MTDFMCNVLIMGKTGSGKSSLLNYLCDKKLAETGAGHAVTGEGLFPYQATIKKQQIRFFDSWGIEAGKTDRWIELIKDALKEHGVEKSMEEWFHSVIYCIQAGGQRIEKLDTEIISRFLKECYHLTIVLTKADQLSPQALEKFKEEIYKEIKLSSGDKADTIKIIPCCTQKLQLRSGNSRPFGRNEILSSIIHSWQNTIVDRIPKHISSKICKEIDLWADKEKEKLKEKNIVSGMGIWNKGLYRIILQNGKKKISQIQNTILPGEIQEAVESCKKANFSLVNTENLKVEDCTFNNKNLKKTQVQISELISQFVGGLLFFPLLVQLISAATKKRQENERQKIETFIDELAGQIKEKIISLENDIKKIIQQALDF